MPFFRKQVLKTAVIFATVPLGAITLHNSREMVEATFEQKTYNRLLDPYTRTIFDKERFRQLSSEYQMLVLNEIFKFLENPAKTSPQKFVEDQDILSIFCIGLERAFEYPIDNDTFPGASQISAILEALNTNPLAFKSLIEKKPEMVKLMAQAFYRQIKSKKSIHWKNKNIDLTFLTFRLFRALKRCENFSVSKKILRDIGYFSDQRKSESRKIWLKYNKEDSLMLTFQVIKYGLLWGLVNKMSSKKKFLVTTKKSLGLTLITLLLPYGIFRMFPKIEARFKKREILKNSSTILFSLQLASVSCIGILSKSLWTIPFIYYILFYTSKKFEESERDFMPGFRTIANAFNQIQ
ncbi:hypothetical protein MHBO_000505 [Bonamia ostreae]|uniref:Uncharacterized protein n=1 Tax=Bonamia ostreae TaxID=126728 RepID=A0ABV2AFW8_9EUKA